jgi:hypothetical protein
MRIHGARVTVCVLLLLLVAPSSFAADVFTSGQVHLADCFGANANVVPLTRAEERQLDFVVDDVVVLRSDRSGRAGASFLPAYGTDEIPLHESNFQAVNLPFNADDDGLENTKLRFCFEGTIKSFPLSSFKSEPIALGWRRVIIGARKLGLEDNGAIAPRLDKLTVALEGKGNISVGNVVVRFGPPDDPRTGRDGKIGESIPDNFVTKPETCAYLSTCPIPLRRLRR